MTINLAIMSRQCSKLNYLIFSLKFALGAGFDALDTIVILGNQTTVDKLKKGDAKFGMDIDLIVGKDSSLAQTDSSWTEAETAVGMI